MISVVKVIYKYADKRRESYYLGISVPNKEALEALRVNLRADKKAESVLFVYDTVERYDEEQGQ